MTPEQIREALDAWAAGDRSHSDDKQAYAALGLLLDGSLSDILRFRGVEAEKVWWCGYLGETVPKGKCHPSWQHGPRKQYGCGPVLLVKEEGSEG